MGLVTEKHRPLVSGIAVQVAKNDGGELVRVGGATDFGTLTGLATLNKPDTSLNSHRLLVTNWHPATPGRRKQDGKGRRKPHRSPAAGK